MATSAVLALIGVIAASLISASVSSANNSANLKAQEEANAQNQANQEKTWELQSVTNKVKEYEENGINKQLVSGIAPNYSLSANIKPVMSDVSGITNSLGKVMDSLDGINTKVLQAQQTENAKKQNDLISAQISGLEIENATKAYVLKTMKERGIIPGDSSHTKDFQYFSGLAESIFGINPVEAGKNTVTLTKRGFNWLVDTANKSADLGINLSNKFIEKGKIKNSLKKDYNDSWRSNSNSYMPIKVNPHYK